MSDEQPGQPSGQTPPPGSQPPNWGNAYPPPSQYPPGYQPVYYGPPKHPQATTAMIMGILGLAVCGVLAPIAWVMGSRAVTEIDANPAAYTGRGEAIAGKIMGIVGSCFLVFGFLALLGFIVLAVTVERADGFVGGGL